MVILDWINPKTTIADLDTFLGSYLGSKYDGIIVSGNKATIMTTSDMTSEEDAFIRDWYNNLNGLPTSVFQTPFASKTISTPQGIKKLYKRIHGIQENVVVGENTIIYVISYDWVKITGIELINGDMGDTISLMILDTLTGTNTGEPNRLLNQFAFDLNVGEKYYLHSSEYDADLTKGLQVKIVYKSVSPKTIYINMVLNEVK